MKIYKKKAKEISYGGTRDLKNVKYIAIHYTGNKGDTAKSNANFFATSNKREAGAHYFLDKKPEVWESVPLNRIAYAVGGFFTRANGAGKYYGKCSNSNSVSIELCDCTKEASWEQIKTAKDLVEYIQGKCPNAKTIIRHWDVNGKDCPAPMTGKNNKKWKHFHSYITKGYQFEGKVKKKAAIRSSKGVKTGNKIGEKEKGDTVYITKVSGNWGRLKKKSKDGKWRWIYLPKVKEL